jgi:hypothetical protein
MHEPLSGEANTALPRETGISIADAIVVYELIFVGG